MKNVVWKTPGLAVIAATWISLGVPPVATAQAIAEPDRTVLPIPEPRRPTFTELDVRNAKAPPHFEVRAPAGAPNVLLVLIDDLGFAGTGTFGGPVGTPTFDRIASDGLHYNNFHTTAVCSPTCAALKSGRNHHVNNMGAIIETGTAFPGNTGQIPNEVAPLAEMLRLNGYSTGAFGKWHETAAWEASVAGAFDRWPTRQGFDKFYGFLGGETNQWAPFIYDGTSAEGGRNGMFSEMTYFNGVQEQLADMLKHLDQWGGPETYPHMAAGWAVAFDTPYQWTKQVGSDFGGTKVGMAVRWPKGIKSGGELRTQFSHVIDVAPTILEAARLPEPRVVNGVPQRPMDGVSLVYSFDDAAAKERHTTQYFEMFGNRAIYRDGWLARTIHRAPWESTPRRPLADDIWELYDTRKDFSLVNDLSAKYPEKLAELQALFLDEAEKNHVLPIDDRVFERFIPANVGRPDLMAGRTSLTLAEGMTGMTENVFLNIKNRPKTVIAEVEVPQDRTANGTVLAQGGRFGGWALYVKDGVPAYDYNFLGLQRFTVAAAEKLRPGKSTIRFEFAYDGGGVGKGGMGTLYVNDRKVGEGRIERTQPANFSADETADVGIDLATPVVEAIGSEARSRFTGRIPKVTVQVR
jgi:arylsulfatase A-like enzyme